jgi:hypothetical protein
VATHREVRVNAGGEPERDDFPLPPVDIEIPDDPRELDRDVQAYHREQRAARRRRRLGRLHAPLTKDGLVLPLLAGCLVMVMISGVLLTVFSASNSGAPTATFRPSSSVSPQTPQISATGSSTASPPPANPSLIKSLINPQVRWLVEANVAVGGHVEDVYRLLPAVLALAPADCQCTAALRQLRRQAAAHKVPLYLITTADMQPAAARLARAAGQPASRIAQDPTGQVTDELSLQFSAPGLTAAFVRGNGSIAIIRYNLPGRTRPAARRLAPGFAALAAKP